MTTSIEKTRPHAHADLREGLIAAGLTLLARDGTAGLTLRKCAALAGVSHAAPAHHFDGLPGLLDAIAARGFELFADVMEAHAARAPDEPRARLEAICVGYFDFARDKPALYDLMFRQIWSLAGSSDELRQSGARAYAVLADTCAPFVRSGQQPGVVETQVWSLIHGYASLVLVGKLGRNSAIASVTEVLGLLDRLPLAD